MVQYDQHLKDHQMVVIPSNGGAPINMKEAHIDELGGFPLDMTRNAYYDNKFPTGYNEAFFVIQPMDILDYVEEHAPESLDEVKKKKQVHIGRPEPCAIGHKLEIKVASGTDEEGFSTRGREIIFREGELKKRFGV